MTNGDKLREQMAELLFEGEGNPPSNPRRRRGSEPSTPRLADLPASLTDNPLYLATQIDVPTDYPAGYGTASYTEGTYLQDNVAFPSEYNLTPQTNRPPGHEHYSPASGMTQYLSAADSTPPTLSPGEIVEVNNMPHDEYHVPIDVDNLNNKKKRQRMVRSCVVVELVCEWIVPACAC